MRYSCYHPSIYLSMSVVANYKGWKNGKGATANLAQS